MGNLIFLSCLILSQKLEKEKAAREKAEAERKRLEEEIALLKASQEKQARGRIWKCILKNFLRRELGSCCFSHHLSCIKWFSTCLPDQNMLLFFPVQIYNPR